MYILSECEMVSMLKALFMVVDDANLLPEITSIVRGYGLQNGCYYLSGFIGLALP